MNCLKLSTIYIYYKKIIIIIMGVGFRSHCHYLPVRNFPRACLVLVGHLPKSKRPQTMTQSSPSMDTVPHSKPSQNARLRAVG